jgi:hypothetical protein
MLRWSACEIALQTCLANDVTDKRSYAAIDATLGFMDGDISDAARAAAWDAARDAAMDAAWAAARDEMNMLLEYYAQEMRTA